MVLVGLVNLAERLLNQSDTQGQDTQLTQKTANSQAVQGAPGGVEDRFTPSTQDPQTHANAQDAGLFSVAQFSFFSAAADLFLRQTVGATTNPAPAGANGGNGNAPAAAPQAAPAAVVTPLAGLLHAASNANNSGISSNGNANAGTNAAGGTTVGTIGAANAGGASAANNSAAANSLIAQQQQLQALNNSLVTLGLTPQQITQLDQIAAIISDFNPTFFTALAYQLQELAQAQQALASATAGGAQTAAPNSATANVNGAPANAIGAGAVGANGGGFQIQELAIRFTGIEAQGTAPANATAAGQTTPANGNGNIQAAAFNLQIEEVNLTLVNGNGQTAQIQAPSQRLTRPLSHGCKPPAPSGRTSRR